jgi:putative ABC transport system substrate-binding protein
MISKPMHRRSFITLLGGAAAWPIAARAQQAPLPVIGILGSSTVETWALRTANFMQGLKEIGFVEGQNVAIESRWANDQYDRLPGLAADLVSRRVSLIAAIGNNLPARAAKGATSTVPIIFAMGADPVQLGLVASLNKPGGNITGITVLTSELIPKRLQLLHDLVPSAKLFGFLANPDNVTVNSLGTRTDIELAQDTVRNWGGSLEVAYARTVGEFDTAFASLAQKRIEAFATGGDALQSSGRLIALAAQYAIPAAFHSAEFTKAGGLMSYNSDGADGYRHAGRYAGRVLKGEKPADLPVLLPTKFEFVLNMQTARLLGIDVPPTLLAIADAVIE